MRNLFCTVVTAVMTVHRIQQPLQSCLDNNRVMSTCLRARVEASEKVTCPAVPGVKVWA